MRYRIRMQRRIKGIKRQPVHSAFIEEIERAVQREMRFFRVSRSFVIATAVAHALGVDEQEDYRPNPRRKRKVA